MRNWAARWSIPHAAILELYQALAPVGIAPSFTKPSGPEAQVQQELRVLAPHRGAHLWRNNNGVLTNEHGVPVRYGLGNDSKRINTVLKSSDLIGPTPVEIRPQDVGRTVAVFTAVEVKRPGWRGPKTSEEKAQATFLKLIYTMGGIATFATQPSDYTDAIQRWIK
jgi:hypothetical protein